MLSGSANILTCSWLFWLGTFIYYLVTLHYSSHFTFQFADNNVSRVHFIADGTCVIGVERQYLLAQLCLDVILNVSPNHSIFPFQNTY